MTFVILLLLAGCASSQKEIEQRNWPEKLQDIEIGLTVVHSTDTVYATINTKDPEKRGRYQMKFTTTVESMNENLEIVEFGGYFWQNEKWVFKSIYDRPFNKDEFDKWYDSENGKIVLGKRYSDIDNWLGKGDYLNGKTYKALLYFIGKNSKGDQFIGAKEIVGVMNFEK